MRRTWLLGFLVAVACAPTTSGISDPGTRPACDSGADCASGVCTDGVCAPVPGDDAAVPLFDTNEPETVDAPAEPGGPDDGSTNPDPGSGPDAAPVPCTEPLDWTCKDASTRIKCSFGVLAEQPCGEQHVCAAGTCQVKVCEPGATTCTGPTTLHKCNAAGTGWDADQVCPAGVDVEAVCDPVANKCDCRVPVNVLFVVDASGSMQLEEVSPGVTQWDVALDAIGQIMGEYPFLKFGLATFPDQTVTCGALHCEGGGGCAYADGVNLDVAAGQVPAIGAYLAARKLSAEPANLKYVLTPLLGIFDYLANTYPATGPLKAHQVPSYVVLLSDGQDSCYNPANLAAATAPLAARAAQLLEQYQVKTFAVGFNLADGFEQLDAIAMHGGTGLASHVSAGDLASLLAAFEGIFDTMQIHKCGAWDDAPKPPDCPDDDADGWCASLDCDDGAGAVHLGAVETAGNGEDDDCDGQVDEPPDDQLDQDGDGFTPAQGDCRDFDASANPDAIEEPDDGLDNDCDGQVDEVGCACTPTTGATLTAMACAAEIACAAGALQDQDVASPSGDDLTGAWTAVSHFGAATNDLLPKAGPSYALLATGPAMGSSHSTDLPGYGSWTDPYSSSDDGHDVAEWTVTLTAPANAKGFSVDYVFFSEEYDDYVGTPYNDKFYILMQAPQTTSGQKRVINFTDCRDPSGYHDLSGAACPLPSGTCCYIAINTALSECCWVDGCPDGTWTTDIAGTGYSCAASSMFDSDGSGSSTGWLTTSWPIQPSETFTLTFHVHDTSDGIYDSEVLLDNFRWHSTTTAPGTEPAGD